jgi:hypothetical protein
MLASFLGTIIMHQFRSFKFESEIKILSYNGNSHINGYGRAHLYLIKNKHIEVSIKRVNRKHFKGIYNVVINIFYCSNLPALFTSTFLFIKTNIFRSKLTLAILKIVIPFQ